jgi:hypothetical protein
MHSFWLTPKLLNALATDLLYDRERYDVAFQKETFVQRQAEGRLLHARIDEIQDFGGNVLIVGDPGIGKSSFISWFLTDSIHAKSADPCTFRLDLKDTGASMLAPFLFAVQLKLLEATRHFINSIHGDPCHDIPCPGDVQNFAQAEVAYHKATAKLAALAVKKLKSRLHLFVDDIDYVDSRFFSDFAIHLRPFLSSPHCCVIFAARRPAYNALMADDDFQIGRFFDPQETIELDALDTHDVIQARIRIACLSGNTDARSKGIMIRDLVATSARYAKTVGEVIHHLFCEEGSDGSKSRAESVVDHSSVLALPFTDKQLDFIQRTSNGNIRTMLLLARRVLEYIAREQRDLHTRVDGKIEIGRSRLIDEFADDARYGKHRICNLHAKKTSTAKGAGALGSKDLGYSLYVLLLEHLHDFKTLDTESRKRICTYGFTTDQIEEGILDLYGLGMIEEKYVTDLRALGPRDPIRYDFILTDKGQYYIGYMVHWDEYIAAFGRSQHHLEGGGPNVHHFIKMSVLQFLAAIGSVWAAKPPSGVLEDARINKRELCRVFGEMGRELLVWANRADKVAPVDVTLDRFSELLLELDVIRRHGLERSDCFLVDFKRVKKICLRNGVRWHVWPPFVIADVKEFVDERVYRTVDAARRP